MPGRRSSAGRSRQYQRRQSASQIDWRYAQNTTDLALEQGGSNGFIDPEKAIGKLKRHGVGLWSMQALVAFIMAVVAVVADVQYGVTYYYTNTEGGGKLREMQYAWAFLNTLCAICGVWVYLLWSETVGVDRNQRVFRQKVHIWMSYFTWAFGIWTTAVVLVSFENYSFTGNYPTNLTCAFLGAVVCCLTSDLWALGKLCSLGTYTARLEEEWRFSPHEPEADPQELMETAHAKDIDREDSNPNPKDMDIHQQRRMSQRSRRGSRSKSGEQPLSYFSEYSTGIQILFSVTLTTALARWKPALPQPWSYVGELIASDDVLLPHVFERLWGTLEPQGAFQTRITVPVPQDRVVRHLSDRGFQVIAAGTIGTQLRILFCAKEATDNGTGDWFLGEFLVDGSALTLDATFKSRKASLVPAFVQNFLLHQLYTMAPE
ncbi:unnamed protein product [Discosporangium mesarthrocarpum]